MSLRRLSSMAAPVIAAPLVLSVRDTPKMGRAAAVAQLVERELPKLEVAGSKPVRRLLSGMTPSGAGKPEGPWDCSAQLDDVSRGAAAGLPSDSGSWRRSRSAGSRIGTGGASTR